MPPPIGIVDYGFLFSRFLDSLLFRVLHLPPPILSAIHPQISPKKTPRFTDAFTTPLESSNLIVNQDRRLCWVPNIIMGFLYFSSSASIVKGLKTLSNHLISSTVVWPTRVKLFLMQILITGISFKCHGLIIVDCTSLSK